MGEASAGKNNIDEENSAADAAGTIGTAIAGTAGARGADRAGASNGQDAGGTGGGNTDSKVYYL